MEGHIRPVKRWLKAIYQVYKACVRLRLGNSPPVIVLWGRDAGIGLLQIQGLNTSHIYKHTCMHTYILTYLTLYNITLHCVTLSYITFHYATLHYASLHNITLQYLA